LDKKTNEKTHLFFKNEKIEKKEDRKKIHHNPQSHQNHSKILSMPL
jgi:hypothetical protein